MRLAQCTALALVVFCGATTAATAPAPVALALLASALVSVVLGGVA